MTMQEYLAYEARQAMKWPKVVTPETTETVESDLHSKIREECRSRGWICLTGSMAHRAMRTIGEPDFTVLADNGRVFFIEAKSKTGKLRPEQAAIAAWAKKLGHTIHVVRSMEEFLEITKTL